MRNTQEVGMDCSTRTVKAALDIFSKTEFMCKVLIFYRSTGIHDCWVDRSQHASLGSTALASGYRNHLPLSHVGFRITFKSASLRYEFDISADGCFIVWVNRPFAPGANPDVEIF